jgi:trimeric autotransporter adhesin
MKSRNKTRFALQCVAALLASTIMAAAADAAPVLTLRLRATKAFQFSWTSVAGSTHYRLLEDPTGSSGFTQVGPNIAATSTSFEHIVALYRRVNARYIVQACNASSCVDSNTVHASGSLARAIGYFKASTVGEHDQFGWSVALSSNGTTLAVSAPGEDSSATGVNGNSADNNAQQSGAVYVFVRPSGGSVWVQQAYIKASNTDAHDSFGVSLALSADGSTLAVGATGESSSATGVNGNQANNDAPRAGAVYVYVRLGSVWSQEAYIKASNTDEEDNFGNAVSLSGNGFTLAVGAPREGSGSGHDPLDNSAPNAGAVYVYRRISSVWTQVAYLKASNPGAGVAFGKALDLSNDGLTLAVGAPGESSSATGVNGNQANNDALDAGAVYVYANIMAAVWLQQAYIKASNTGAFDRFGASVALSGDGATLVVGAPSEDSGAVGVNGDQLDESVFAAGAVYVFGRAGSRAGPVWAQQAYVKASNTQSRLGNPDQFGHAVALTNDGIWLAVGAWGEPSSSIGINGDQTNSLLDGSGAAYVFAKNSGTWGQRAYVKASSSVAANLGKSVALAGNGGTLAVGGPNESGSSFGINGPQNTQALPWSGAVYIY